MSERLYLDHAATSPLHPAAAAELERGASALAAPSAEAAAERLGRALGLSPARLVLTQGGSQANALALRVLAERGRAAGLDTILSQPTEHPSVLETLGELEREGFALEWLRVDPQGRVDPAEVVERLGAGVACVTVMSANHETGVLQPIRELAQLCAQAGVLLHSDAVQAFRFARPSQLPGDLLTLGGHKLGGPRGVGALVLGSSCPPELRVALGKALQPCPASVAALAAAIEARALGWDPALAASRDLLETELAEQIPGLEVNGGREEGARLPGHLSLSLSGLSGEALVLDLDLAGIAASTGAACASGSEGPSPVLLAMGRTRAQAAGSLRLTLSEPLSVSERERVVGVLAASVTRLRGLA